VSGVVAHGQQHVEDAIKAAEVALDAARNERNIVKLFEDSSQIVSNVADQLRKAQAAAEVAQKQAAQAGKVLGVLKTTGKVLDAGGLALSYAQTVIAIKEVATGETDHVGDILGGIADLNVGVLGVVGGLPGATAAAGYAGGTLGATYLDENTDHFNDAVEVGHRVEGWIHRTTDSYGLARFGGAVVSGLTGAFATKVK
jgi:hypothetical protein